MAAPAGRTQSAPARDVLAATRAALGGERALSAFRGLHASGRARRLLGPIQMESAVDVHVATPDRYVRVDRLALAATRSEMAVGFNGDRLVQRATGPDGSRIDPAQLLAPAAREMAARTALANAKQDYALLMLGFLCGSVDAFPLVLSTGGVAEAPDGRAGILNATAANGFSARLFIDVSTSLPLMVAWTGPDIVGSMRALSAGGARNGGAAPDVSAVVGALQQPVEHRLYFSDYRRVGPYSWPFRIRRAVGGETIEDLSLERLTHEPPADGTLFDPGPEVP